ncbi:MAG: hypothetical protein C5B60_02630 [Chloroflexi bacterium]|nr:MAG: hypothetical protein C5B60_02630 [Chloroflexota bacterium]
MGGSSSSGSSFGGSGSSGCGGIGCGSGSGWRSLISFNPFNTAGSGGAYRIRNISQSICLLRRDILSMIDTRTFGLDKAAPVLGPVANIGYDKAVAAIKHDVGLIARRRHAESESRHDRHRLRRPRIIILPH